jgi:hypothetical protein
MSDSISPSGAGVTLLSSVGTCPHKRSAQLATQGGWANHHASALVVREMPRGQAPLAEPVLAARTRT